MDENTQIYGIRAVVEAIKTSAGAAFNVPIAKVDHLKDVVFYLQASGIKVIAASEKTEHTIYTMSFNEPCAIVMGSEDTGISPSIFKAADATAKLPLQVPIQMFHQGAIGIPRIVFEEHQG